MGGMGVRRDRYGDEAAWFSEPSAASLPSVEATIAAKTQQRRDQTFQRSPLTAKAATFKDTTSRPFGRSTQRTAHVREAIEKPVGNPFGDAKPVDSSGLYAPKPKEPMKPKESAETKHAKHRDVKVKRKESCGEKIADLPERPKESERCRPEKVDRRPKDVSPKDHRSRGHTMLHNQRGRGARRGACRDNKHDLKIQAKIVQGASISNRFSGLGLDESSEPD
ncbi:MAG: hypothetical protein KVP17_000645 [Porospora cf. gigantea B]|uniref:uncharacterized protein n=1 Tax=Porospora cf. gigantea B TaxID=2853592 RepID=UPI003571D854|nr:MAG: hypothetical protein KVP17_000645 [Porospora cf. gigantea B]